MERADLRPQRVARHRVERAERLVEQQQLRPRRQRAGDGDALPLPTRQRVGHACRDRLRQCDEVEQPRDVGGARAGDAWSDADILGDGHVREQADALEDIADPPAQRGCGAGGDVLPVQQHLAGRRLDQPVDRLEQRRLARSRRADERNEAAGRDGEVDAVHRPRLAISLGNGVETERFCWHRRRRCGMPPPKSNEWTAGESG